MKSEYNTLTVTCAEDKTQLYDHSDVQYVIIVDGIDKKESMEKRNI